LKERVEDLKEKESLLITRERLLQEKEDLLKQKALLLDNIEASLERREEKVRRLLINQRIQLSIIHRTKIQRQRRVGEVKGIIQDKPDSQAQ
jgi:predicted XRE-type DNA-binding protein